MNKNDFVREVATRTGLSIKDTGIVFNTMVDVLVEGINRDERVAFAGFGTFSKKYRKARTGRNPLTGEQVSIPASRVPGFKAGKTFKNSIN